MFPINASCANGQPPRPPTAESKRRQHLRQRTALFVEHDARTNAHDARAFAGRSERFVLPALAHLGEEIRSAGRRFGDRLVAKRRDQFENEFVVPLVAEAAKLGITPHQLEDMISRNRADKEKAV